MQKQAAEYYVRHQIFDCVIKNPLFRWLHEIKSKFNVKHCYTFMIIINFSATDLMLMITIMVM